MTPIVPELAAAAVTAAAGMKTANEIAKLPGVAPVVAVVNERVQAFVRARLGPVLQRILPLPEAARIAVDEAVARLGDVAPEALIEPDPTVTAGVFEAMQTRADVPELRAMFGELLATAMHPERAGNAHPAFVEAIRQLSVDDARMFAQLNEAADYVNSPTGRLLAGSILLDSRRLVIRDPMAFIAAAGCARPVPSSDPFANLERVGLVSVQHEGSAYPDSPRGELRITVEVTRFGEHFIDVCLPRRSPFGEAGGDSSLSTSSPTGT